MKTAVSTLHTTPGGRLAIGFLMLCLLFRAAIPAGFMPAMAGQGDADGSLIKLCHGDAGSAQLLDMLEPHDTPSPSSHSVVKHEQCAFSAFILLAVSDIPAFTLDVALAETFETLRPRVFKSFLYSSHPARAPPFAIF